MTTTNERLRTWLRGSYIVREAEFDGDLREFYIEVKGGETLAIITPDNLDDYKRIVDDLDCGEDVYGWEDGLGNEINF